MQNKKSFFLLGLAIFLTSANANAATFSKQQIIEEAQRVADAQLRALGEKTQTDWVWGAMEAGYSDFSHVAPNGVQYSQMLARWADKMNWTPHVSPRLPFHADDVCIGYTFEDLYSAHPDAGHLAPLKSRLDALVDQLNKPVAPADKLTWWWCDAIFMAPPVMARMTAITGDKKYIDAMDREFWRNNDLLCDRQDHLYYRDSRFIGKPDANGKKVFWSRGNGWVIGALPRILQYMPIDYPSRPKYEQLFKDMADKLSALQSTDGTWSTSLVDPAVFTGPETSGTSFITYGLAWGINNKLLDREKYLPIVTKGWNALLKFRRPDGLPGYTQLIGFQPAIVKPEGTQLYTTGGYLLAASELQKLAPLEMPDQPAKTQP